MIQMEKRHWQIIQAIFAKYSYDFYIFGSRIKNKAKPLSDLDICYKEPIPGSIIVQIEGELEDSDLPFKVEIIDWNNCSKEFQQLIENDLVLLNKKSDE